MIKKILGILSILVLCFALVGCGNNDTKEKEEKKEKEVVKKTIDYMVLVNKENKLPDDWEDIVELVESKDAWGDKVQIEKKAYDAYLKLKEDLEKEKVYIELDSIYRSVAEQQDLWDRWTKEKGIDYVKKYVAVPGYSEHHTGLAIDICIKKNGKLIYENDDMIAEKKIFAKIHEKLPTYGFILRYPKGKDKITGYSYEPWHLRYIDNVDIAKEIYDTKLTFEEYLKNNKN